MELATRTRRRREIGSGSAFERKEDRETGIEGGEREGRRRGEGGERREGERKRAYKYEEEGTLACKVGVTGSKTGSLLCKAALPLASSSTIV